MNVIHETELSPNEISATAEKKRARRKGRGIVRFGDEDFTIQETEDLLDTYEKASFGEVCTACCFRSEIEWLWMLLAVIILVGSLYWLVFGLTLLGDAAKVLAGCGAGKLFDSDSNPLSALMVGIIATVLMQSSSTTTTVIVSLTEARAISVAQGIYMVMGANVGTTVTSTIVSLAQMGKSAELDRSFAAATLHDVFNIFTVAILFPVECATGYLQHLTGALAEGAETGRRDHFEGPIKKFVSPLSARLLTSNKKLIVGVANGKTCDDYYPIHCDEGAEPSFATCKVGLIGCYESTGRCPVLFRESASRTQDQVAGAVCFVIALIILFVSMLSMVFAVQKLLFGLSTKVVHTVTTCNGYIGFLVGIGITMITQSSSITTSVLVPFAGVGALRLEQVYPLVLGANMGTAVQAVVSSLDAVGTDPLQVALAHLFFNLTGFLIWYPLPPLRNIPFFAARRLGKNAGIWRMFPLCYIVLVFCLLPLFFWGLSSLYENGSAGLLAIAVLLTLVAGFALALLMFWCNFRNGQSKFHSILDRLSHRNDKPSQTYDAEGNFDIDADGDNVSGEKDTVENP